MGIFSDRTLVHDRIRSFLDAFIVYYHYLAQQKYPSLFSQLPFTREGIDFYLVYAKELFLIFSRNSKSPPYSFMSGGCRVYSWDESEYPKLSDANCIDDIVEILGIEQALFHKTLDSPDPEYLADALGEKAAEELAEQLLEEHIITLQS